MPIEIKKETKKNVTVYIASVRVRKTKPPFNRSERIRFNDRILAQQWASKKEREFLDEYENLAAGNPIELTVDDITLEGYLDALIEYVESNKLKDFKKGDWSCIKKWRKFPIAKKFSSELNDQDFVEHFSDRIMKDKVTAATNHRDMVPLINALAWQDRIKIPFNNGYSK